MMLCDEVFPVVCVLALNKAFRKYQEGIVNDLALKYDGNIVKSPKHSEQRHSYELAYHNYVYSTLEYRFANRPSLFSSG